MNGTDLSHFSLSKVDGRLGYEKSRSELETGIHVTIVIKPYTDLILDGEVAITFNVPFDFYFKGGVTASTTSRDAIRLLKQYPITVLNDSGDGITFTLPGMEKAKYMLPVWFYAVRYYFQANHGDEPTQSISALLLDTEFRNVYHNWPSYTPSMDGDNTELVLVCGSGRTRGKRNYMEDVDFVYDDISVGDKHAMSVFGVLDGHGGKECAQYCSEEIPIKISALMRNGSTCSEALFKSFLEVDKEFLESDTGQRSGSTANVAVYDKRTNVIYVANTGDTRAVLSRGGKALDVTYDRKGSDPQEVARVVRSGGFVVNGRLQGTLAVSRALGDIQLKEQGPHKLQRVLIPDPELSCFYPTRTDDFLLIATDGLWDVMSSQAAVDHVRNLLDQEGLGGAAGGSEDLSCSGATSALGRDVISMRLSQIANNTAVHAVSNLNSMDNVTVLIVLLRGGPVSVPPGMLTALASQRGSQEQLSLQSSTKSNDDALLFTSNINPTSTRMVHASPSLVQSDPLVISENSGLDSANGVLPHHKDHTGNSFPVPDSIESFMQSTSATTGSNSQPSSTWHTADAGRTVMFSKGNSVVMHSGNDSAPAVNTTGNSQQQQQQQQRPSMNSGNSSIPKVAQKIVPIGDDDDDDLMDFLNDDSNF